MDQQVHIWKTEFSLIWDLVQYTIFPPLKASQQSNISLLYQNWNG